MLTAGTPPKPKGLNRLESVFWNHLVKNLAARRTLHPSQGVILHMACSYYWQFKKASEACKDSSPYETRSREGAVIYKQQPKAALMLQAMKGLVACLEHLA